MSINHDHASARRSSAALRASEEKLRLITDAVPALIAYVDAEQRYRFNNKAYEEWFKCSRDQIYGKHIAEVLGEPAYQLIRKHVERALTGQAVSYQARMPYKSGGTRYIVTSFVPDISEQGVVRGYVSLVNDISVQKRSERALRRGEERVRSILNSALDAVVTMNEHGIITGWNPQAAKIFGWERDEAIDRVLADLIIPEEYREAHRRGLAQYLATGQGAALNKRLELTALRKGGEIFPIELAISPLELSGGRFEFSAFVRDITERKQMEVLLRQTNQLLEQRVEQRTAELARRAEELRRANDALTRSNLELQQFAYIASHDLQSPLRSIGGFVQALQAEYKGKLSAQADEWIQRTVQATQKMQTLIHDLLEYSRVDARSRPFKRIHFHKIFDDAVALLDASIRESRAEIICGDLPMVMGDRSQLVQLMQNLVGNAVKFHSGETPRVNVRAERRDNAWMFSVRDNGIGIEPKFHERIFDIFKRLHGQEEYPGTGIGLAVCRRVVHRHGGKIWVDSDAGHGSVFYFTIPESTASLS